MNRETPAVREAVPVYTTEAPETERVPPGYKRTEVGEIPEDWDLLPVGSMGEVVAGKALAKAAPGLLRPYLRTKNVFDGRIDIGDVLSMPMTDPEFTRYELRDGDVLLNEGQTLELVGRCSIYRGEYPEPCAIQNQLIRFRARSGVSPTFAMHLFRYCQKTGVFARIALQTTSVAHLGVSRFQRLTLAWPSSEAEQHAIAAALSDVDALISSLDELIAKKRAVKIGAMQQLLTGKQRLLGFSGKWGERSLGEVAYVKMGQSPSSRNYNVHSVGLPLIQGNADIENRKTIARVWTTQITKACDEGDIVLTVRAPVGNVSIASMPSCLGRGVCSLIPMGVERVYLFHALAHAEAKWKVLEQGSTFTSANSDQISKFRIKCPKSREEQSAIAAVFSDMDAEISALEARREKTRQIKQGMMQELLTGRTRLVPARFST